MQNTVIIPSNPHGKNVMTAADAVGLASRVQIGQFGLSHGFCLGVKLEQIHTPAGLSRLGKLCSALEREGVTNWEVSTLGGTTGVVVIPKALGRYDTEQARTPEPSPAPAQPITVSLFFAREERFTISTLGEMDIVLVPEQPPVVAGQTAPTLQQQAMRRLNAALSQWIEQTEEGLAVWEQAAEALNIGDLALNALDDSTSFAPFLAAHGIAITRINVREAGEALPFDLALAYPSVALTS